MLLVSRHEGKKPFMPVAFPTKFICISLQSCVKSHLPPVTFRWNRAPADDRVDKYSRAPGAPTFSKRLTNLVIHDIACI